MRRNYLTNSQSKGFTLVELLVTIGVLGILSSMSVAQYEIFRQAANDTAAMSAGRNVATAITAYTIDGQWDPNVTTVIDFEISASGENSRGSVGDQYDSENFGSSTFLPGYSHQKGVHLAVVIYLNNTYNYGIYTGSCKGSYSPAAGDGDARTVYELIGQGFSKYPYASWIVPNSYACDV